MSNLFACTSNGINQSDPNYGPRPVYEVNIENPLEVLNISELDHVQVIRKAITVSGRSNSSSEPLVFDHLPRGYYLLEEESSNSHHPVDVNVITGGSNSPITNCFVSTDNSDSHPNTVLFRMGYLANTQNNANVIDFTRKEITSKSEDVKSAMQFSRVIDNETVPKTGHAVLHGHAIITNDAEGYELPETGGPGTDVLTTSGIALLAVSAALYIRQRQQVNHNH